MIGWGLIFLVFLVVSMMLHKLARDKEASVEAINQQSLSLTDLAGIAIASAIATAALYTWLG